MMQPAVVWLLALLAGAPSRDPVRATASLSATSLRVGGTAASQDPVRATASLSTTSLRVGETAVLEIRVETRGPAPESIELPGLPSELEVVGTSDYSEFQFAFPGGRTRVVRRELVLLARAPGELQLRPAIVRVRGVEYRTQSLALTVSASGGAPGASSGPGDEVLLRAWLDPPTVYPGQQVTLRAEALFSEDVQTRLRRPPEYQPPSSPGFWIHDLPDDGVADVRTIGDQVYQVQRFQRAYFPLAPGRYVLPPARLLYDARRGFLYAPESHELASDSLRLLVLPLPEAGRPASFTGAVGRYSVHARLEPEAVPAGEAAVLIVDVEGQGNVKAAPPPKLPSIADVEAYPPSEDAEIGVEGGRVRGTKSFSWVLIPKRGGRLQIPAIEYGFFDPERKEYDVAHTAPLALRVLAGGGDVARPQDEGRIRFLKFQPASDSPLRWVRAPAFAALQLLPLAALLWGVWWRRRAAEPRPPSRRALRRRRRRALAELSEQGVVVDADFFARFGDALRAWLGERLGDDALRRIRPRELSERLGLAGVSHGNARALGELLARLEQARYRPDPPGLEARRALLADAERLLDAIDREARRPVVARAPAALALALLAGLAGWPAVASARTAAAQQAGAGEFGAAIVAFQQGDAAAARDLFLSYVRRYPEDPHAWYNLGNAYYAAGEEGRAVWAWLKALRLSPRDADVRHNLAVAGASSALVRRGQPRLPLGPDEALLLASLLWFASAGAFALWLRGRRGWGTIAAGTLVLSFAVLASWIEPRVRQELGVVLEPDTRLLAAPVLRAEPIRQLTAGAGLRLVGSHDGWLRVRTLRGTEGWLEEVQVGRL
ncbi:MAG: BatD family protein [Gemmatimonadetes bacterium]|nr:BatD family protein [Gemmatimonadota bacterium]